MIETPYLSLVAVSRNDDHGGNTLQRTQVFVDGFLNQCERYGLEAELILVEWNPPADKKPLAEAINWGRANSFVDCRVITVGKEIHDTLQYAAKLPLFQMIGKNVGIQRAKGEFVLATNIDILFSDELMEFIASRTLRPDRLYRCDRFDVDPEIADPAVPEKLDFAWKNIVRRNRRMKPWFVKIDGSSEDERSNVPAWMAESDQFEEIEYPYGSAFVLKADARHQFLHCNACGDFTLLHRSGWEAIGGYAELELYSLHIDTLGVQCAHRAGFLETWLAPPMVCFHIEHSLGSGFTANQQFALFDRLANQGIGWFNYHDILPLIEEMENALEALEFNHPTWGMSGLCLPETVCLNSGLEPGNPAASSPLDATPPFTAIKEAFEPIQVMRRALGRQKLLADKEQERLKGQILHCRTHFERCRAKLKKAHESARAHHLRHKTAVADLKLRVAKGRDELRKKHTEKLNHALTDLKSDLSNSKMRETQLAAELAKMRIREEELTSQLTETKSRLDRYRRVFGRLERLGWFR